MTKQEMKSLLKAQQGELDAVLMYKALADVVKDPKDAELFRQLAAEEGHHAAVFKKLTGVTLKPGKAKAVALPRLYKALGRKKLYLLIARGEYAAVKTYEPVVGKFPETESVKDDEKRHGDLVMGLLEEEAPVDESPSSADIREAIKNRHSVRQYKPDPIPPEVCAELEALIAGCNEESGLHMQLITDDPECFDTLLGHYGKFTNVRNYIAVVGPGTLPDLEEKGGYYGQKVVIAAQMKGLNTCWVAGTYGRGKCKAAKEPGEKLICVIAIGYGETQGVKHKSKPVSKLCDVNPKDMPVWFRNGVKAAMMAPTAMNQQSFFITLKDGEPVITAGLRPLAKLDLGIVKYNFDAVAEH